MEKDLDLATESDFNRLLAEERALLFYFATDSCSVGEALAPKVRTLLKDRFPEVWFVLVDMNLFQRISADQNVFVEPTILFFVDGKEYFRMSRNLHLADLEVTIKRIYDLAFE
jgi:thioredoxin-like negative regulator of GroEL